MHFRGVNETANVGVGDKGRGEEEVFLESGGCSRRPVDFVQRFKGRGCPNDESAEVASWRELEQIERKDRAGFHARDIAEGADEVLAVGLGVVDDEGTATLTIAASSHLAFSRA